jgi:phage anti-repressor protein
MIKVNQENKVNGFDIHLIVNSKTPYHKWVKRRINEADLIEGEDFWTSLSESTGGRKETNYYFTINSAKEISLLERNEKGKELRRYLIGLSNKVENHQLLDSKKAAFAMLLINTFKFTDYQIEAELMHKETFKLNNRFSENLHKVFAEYRNNLLDINNTELKERLLKAFEDGKSHKASAKNIRTRILHLDKYELFRHAVIDFLISKGESIENSLLFAQTVKEIATYSNIEIKVRDEENLFDHKENASKPREISKSINE